MPERKIGNEKPGNNTRADGNIEPHGKQWFFGIGISEYDEFPNLGNAVKDVKEINELLIEDYGFLPEHSVTLINQQANKKNIIDELDDLIKKVNSEDSLLVYFAGHGHMVSETQRGFWIPGDAKRDSTSNYLRNSTIREYLADIHSKHTLLIADSCFSGSLFVRGTSRSTAALHELESIPSRWAICSGRHDEEVSDGDPGENSPFAQSILESLRGNTSQLFNVAKLIDRVVEQTRSNYEQLPEGNPVQGVGHKGGQYIFHRLAKEEKFWEECQRTEDPSSYSQYLRQFPRGKYADLALTRIKELEDEAAWRTAKKQNTLSALLTYVRNYPVGKFIEEANQDILILEKQQQDAQAAGRRLIAEADAKRRAEAEHLAELKRNKKENSRTKPEEQTERPDQEKEIAPEAVGKQSPTTPDFKSLRVSRLRSLIKWSLAVLAVSTLVIVIFKYVYMQKEMEAGAVKEATEKENQGSQAQQMAGNLEKQTNASAEKVTNADENQPPDAQPEQKKTELPENQDNYLPIVKVAPVYPARALSMGIEGYCVVEYTVTQQGTVRDPFIVEDQCSSSIFQRPSMRAALKFKYKPRVFEGSPVEVPGVQNKFIYEMDTVETKHVTATAEG